MSKENFKDLQDEELMAIFISSKNINTFEVLLDRYKDDRKLLSRRQVIIVKKKKIFKYFLIFSAK